jgi:ABC-2 type transport system permease protein
VNEFLRRYRSNSTPPVDLALRARFNAELNKGWFSAITGVITSITMLAIVLSGAALIREREHGTIEHLLVMPVTSLEIMAGKIWSMGLIVLVASILSLIVMVQEALRIPLQGSLALFACGAALHLFATTSLGIFLATAAGSMPQFGILLVLVMMPLQMPSGAQTPRESMPQIVQDVMLVAPNTHFVSLAQAILFRGAGFDVVWPQFAMLAFIGSILFAVSLRKFRAFLR